MFAPGAAAAHFGLGQIALGREDFPQALAAMEKVVENEPRNTAALRCVGQLSAIAGKTDAAVAALRKAVEAAPDADSCALLGELLERTEAGPAIDAYEQALTRARREARSPLLVRRSAPAAGCSTGGVLAGQDASCSTTQCARLCLLHCRAPRA